jgi:hypothetical protein
VFQGCRLVPAALFFVDRINKIIYNKGRRVTMENKELFKLIEKFKKEKGYKEYRKILDYYNKHNKIEEKYIITKDNLKDYRIGE